MARNQSATPVLQLTESSLKSASVQFPESVFMLGCRMEYLPEEIREVDRRMHLSMGNILDATPPVFLHLGEFRVAKSMVTNGQYLQFLDHCEQEGGSRMLDSPELWQHVWEGMSFQVKNARMPFERSLGNIEEYEENYSGFTSFVEAYIASIRYEIERCLLGLEHEGDAAARTEALSRLFAYIRFKLQNAILAEDQDLSDLLTDREQAAMQHYTDCEKVLEDIDLIKDSLKLIYGRRLDRRFKQAFERGNHPVETLTFLERFADRLKANPSDLQAPIALREILYPRFWPGKGGRRESPFGSGIPWSERPLTGVSLYEALAYCVWLGYTTGCTVTLPNEAEFERAASWPRGNGIESGRVEIDPRAKAVCPWQEHNPKEFHYYFGQEVVDNDARARRRKAYEQLLQETSRQVSTDEGEEERIYELEGFGWQWTLDRYSENERKYNRFESALYPLFTDAECVTPDGEPLKVFRYRPNENSNDSYFVLKGSPEIIGGPGMTTRRFAAYPFRGYRNVGFRWIIRNE